MGEILRIPPEVCGGSGRTRSTRGERNNLGVHKLYANSQLPPNNILVLWSLDTFVAQPSTYILSFQYIHSGDSDSRLGCSERDAGWRCMWSINQNGVKGNKFSINLLPILGVQSVGERRRLSRISRNEIWRNLIIRQQQQR